MGKKSKGNGSKVEHYLFLGQRRVTLQQVQRTLGASKEELIPRIQMTSRAQKLGHTAVEHATAEDIADLNLSETDGKFDVEDADDSADGVNKRTTP
ncbi:hypothetical protein pdam_00006933, partial [Pocillopora damicornis]